VGDLLSELGKKLAERWLSLLVLPGALYLAVAAVAHTLGQAHPFDLRRLTDQVSAWASRPAVDTAGGQVVLLAAVLAGAAAAGLAAQALGTAAERLGLAADWPAWPRPLRDLAAWRAESRKRRWTGAARTWHQQRDLAAGLLAGSGLRPDPAERHRARRTMRRIAQEEPGRPTWSGDRVDAVAARLERDLHVDLVTVWPPLWLVLPEDVRTQVTAARQALSRAAALAAWAVLYLPLAAWWWPAAVVTAVLLTAGRSRFRTAADTYALLLEAAVRLHARALADHLGLTPAGPPAPALGDALTRHLTSSPPPPPP
jgi:hypothetical protein